MAAFASSISSSLAASSARIKLALTCDDFFARTSRICTRQFLRENFPEISLTSDSSELSSALPSCRQAEVLSHITHRDNEVPRRRKPNLQYGSPCGRRASGPLVRVRSAVQLRV